MEEIRNGENLENEDAILPQEEAIPTPELEQKETPEQGPDGRDFGQEVRDLYAARPELRGEELPEAVLEAAVRGKTVTEAYNDYVYRQRQDADQLRKENRILRQNAKAAAKAPVRGISRGGGTDTQPEDAFLRGFNSAW